jgi:hypothetical protein
MALPFIFLVACSAQDPGGGLPARAFGGPQATSTGTSPNDPNDGPPSMAPPSTKPPTTPEHGSDAGSIPIVPITDASAPPHPDAGSNPIDASTPHDAGKDTGTPTVGALGSCTNPDCSVQGADCFCVAHDSNGNEVQLGCESGGSCGCFDNGQLDNNSVTNENGACGDPTALRAVFASSCNCL